MSETEDVARQINQALADIIEANAFAWKVLLTRLEDPGFRETLTQRVFAEDLEFLAQKFQEIKPDHPLGDERFDVAMVRRIATILMTDGPEPWKPEVIKGGKSD